VGPHSCHGPLPNFLSAFRTKNPHDDCDQGRPRGRRCAGSTSHAELRNDQATVLGIQTPSAKAFTDLKIIQGEHAIRVQLRFREGAQHRRLRLPTTQKQNDQRQRNGELKRPDKTPCENLSSKPSRSSSRWANWSNHHDARSNSSEPELFKITFHASLTGPRPVNKNRRAPKPRKRHLNKPGALTRFNDHQNDFDKIRKINNLPP
jgi:hypothetical protein